MTDTPIKAEPTPDQRAAHEFLSELRTRIATQPLPYQDGVEATALEKPEGFVQARARRDEQISGLCAIRRPRRDGVKYRSAPRHRQMARGFTEGRLSARDGATEFRATCSMFRTSCGAWQANCTRWRTAPISSSRQPQPVMSHVELDKCFKDVIFGIPEDSPLIDKEEIKQINEKRGRRHPDAPRLGGYGHPAAGDIAEAPIKNAVVLPFGRRHQIGDLQPRRRSGAGRAQAVPEYRCSLDRLGGRLCRSFLTSRLGNGQDADAVAHPQGPDPEPIRYIRQHIKFLAAVDVKQAWSMVTATLAGTLLNWSAPLFVIAALALFATLYPLPSVPCHGRAS